MKNLYLFLFCSAVIFKANAITSYKKNDKLFIISPSGLNLRSAPLSNSTIIAKLKLGDAVITLNNKTIENYQNNSITIVDSYKYGKVNLQGSWVKVRVNDLEGYIFDAFTSFIKPAKFNGEIYGLKQLFNKTLFIKEHTLKLKNFGNKKISPTPYSDKKNKEITRTYLYSYGISLTENEETGATPYGEDYVETYTIKQKITLPKSSIEEVFLLIQNSTLLYEFSHIKQPNKYTLEISRGSDISYKIENFNGKIYVLFYSDQGLQC